jgi:putative SOS response-associated peptidase YedK
MTYRPKVTHWFALDETRRLFAFAGIWRLWAGERKGQRSFDVAYVKRCSILHKGND